MYDLGNGGKILGLVIELKSPIVISFQLNWPMDIPSELSEASPTIHRI